MSKLELVASPVVRGLVTGIRAIEELEAHERFIASRWAVKTALALNLASDFKRLASPALLKALAAQPLAIPDGLTVLAAQHAPTQPLGWLQTGSVEFLLPSDIGPSIDARRRLSENGFRIGLQFGGLCLVVVYWPHNQWPLALWPEVHHVLWAGVAELVAMEHRYDSETAPLNVPSRLFLYRAMDTVGAFDRDAPQPLHVASLKNVAQHVSGPEPAGSTELLPIPAIVTPEDDKRIRTWLASHSASEKR